MKPPRPAFAQNLHDLAHTTVGTTSCWCARAIELALTRPRPGNAVNRSLYGSKEPESYAHCEMFTSYGECTTSTVLDYMITCPGLSSQDLYSDSDLTG